MSLPDVQPSPEKAGTDKTTAFVADKEALAPDRRPAAADALRAIGFMCVGVSTFPFMNTAVKLLSPNYPSLQITWVRFTGHLIVMLLVFLPQYRWKLLQTLAAVGADRAIGPDVNEQSGVRHGDWTGATGDSVGDRLYLTADRYGFVGSAAA